MVERYKKKECNYKWVQLLGVEYWARDQGYITPPKKYSSHHQKKVLPTPPEKQKNESTIRRWILGKRSRIHHTTRKKSSSHRQKKALPTPPEKRILTLLKKNIPHTGRKTEKGILHTAKKKGIPHTARKTEKGILTKVFLTPWALAEKWRSLQSKGHKGQNAGRMIVRLVSSKFEIPQMFEVRWVANNNN